MPCPTYPKETARRSFRRSLCLLVAAPCLALGACADLTGPLELDPRFEEFDATCDPHVMELRVSDGVEQCTWRGGRGGSVLRGSPFNRPPAR